MQTIHTPPGAYLDNTTATVLMEWWMTQLLETKFEGREFDYLGQLIVTPNNGSYENKRYEG